MFTSALPTVNGTGAIATDIPDSSSATVSQGTGTNNTLIPAANGYLGVAALHSTGANAVIGAEFDQIYFTPSGGGPTAPIVTSSAATSVTTTAATLNGNVPSDGGDAVTDRGFVYNTSPGVTIADNKTNVAGTTGAFTLTPTLAVNTQYFFKAYGINTLGTTLSSPELSFYTLANTPSAPTVANPTQTSLDVTVGSGDGNPAATAYAIQETTSGNYVQAAGTLGAVAVYATAATWGTKTVTGLGSNTTYTFQVKARNGSSVDTAFGSSASGTTSPGTPSVTTEAASAATTSSATLNGTVTGDGGGAITDRGFYWNTTGTVTTSDSILSEGGTSVAAYSKDLNGLLVNTICYYRAYATNAAGTTLDTADTSFYTLANTPNAPTVDGATGTTLNVTIGTGDGNPAITTYAIQESGGQYIQSSGALGGSSFYQTAAAWGTKTVTGLSGLTSYTFAVIARNGALAETASGPTASGTTLVAPTLLAGWDFQTTATGGTAAAVAPNSPSSYQANIGVGTIYLDGTNNSSTWITATTGNEVTSFAGTALNAGSGFATSTTSPACLALVGGTSNSANGKFVVFKFSMTNRKDLGVSYATQGTGTGFSTQAWEYSTDGTTWTSAGTISSIPSSFATQSLSTITALNNASTAYLRLTPSGASSASGNNRIDNIQLIATDTYSVTYDANAGTGSQTDASSPYSFGSTVTVLGVGSITRPGFTFNGWNTASNGSGTSYSPADTFTISASTTLYAQWTAAPNGPPIAVDDTAMTEQNKNLVVSGATLVSNDSDPESQPLTVVSVGNALNGSVSISAGIVTFVPDLNFTGIASFEYTVSDGSLTDVGLVTVTVTPDVTPPDTSIDSSPTNPSNNASPSFTFSGNDFDGSGVASFECDLDGGGFAACTSPKSYTGLADGLHTFQVRAQDAAGNTDPVPAQVAWTIDTVGPEIVPNSPLPDTTANIVQKYTLTASDNLALGAVTIHYAVKGGEPSSAVCAVTMTFGTPAESYDCDIPGQADGSFVTYYVTASDTAGNTTQSPAGVPDLYTVGVVAIPSGTYTDLSLGDGVTLAGDTTANGIVTFGGVVTTGANTLELGCDATIAGAGAGNYVNGNVKKDYCAVGAFTYPVGQNGYTPLDVTITSVSGASSLTVSSLDSRDAIFDPAQSLKRTWVLTETGNITVDLVFNYLAGDVAGDESAYILWKTDAGSPVNVGGTVNAAAHTLSLSGVSSFSRWTGAGPLAPTASEVSVSGRVLTANGQGIRNARVSVSGNTLPQRLYAMTGPFGFYRIDGLEAGETYVVTVGAKTYVFQVPSRVITLADSVEDLDFIAQP